MSGDACREPGDGFELLVTIDLEGDLETLAASPEGRHRQRARSAGRYGTEAGAPRLLRMLERLGLRADWLVPGHIARAEPDLVRAIADAGHAVSPHGDWHRDFDPLSADDQLAELERGRDAIEHAIGGTSGGFRMPRGEWREGLPERAARAGFRWSSSLSGADAPYPLGESGLIEIPPRYELEDRQYLGFSLDPPFPVGQGRIAKLAVVESNWRLELEGSRRLGVLFHLRLSAEVSGTPARTRMVESVLRRALDEEGAIAATCDEIAARVAQEPPDPSHPYAMFLRLRESERELSRRRAHGREADGGAG